MNAVLHSQITTFNVVLFIFNYMCILYFDRLQFKRFSEDHPPSTEAESNEYETNRYKIEASIRWRDRILESEVVFNYLFSSV